MSEEKTLDIRFLGLVMAHQQAGLQHLGKVADPLTGKIERDLESVQGTIAVLETLERKTRGNLAHEEEQALQEALTFLRLNYVEEMKAEKSARAGDSEAEPAPEAEAPAAD